MKDIEQQTGDMCDAEAVFSQLRVSLCRIEALQQPQQDWKQHFHEAQHTVRHTLCSQCLLDRERRGHMKKQKLVATNTAFPEAIRPTIQQFKQGVLWWHLMSLAQVQPGCFGCHRSCHVTIKNPKTKLYFKKVFKQYPALTTIHVIF